ncbi:MAG: TonB-dependent receptor [Vicinamibacterales bacterium]
MLSGLAFTLFITSQQPAPLSIIVRHDGAPVAGAVVTCATTKLETDKEGRASVPVPPEGCALVVSREGLTPFSQPVTPASPPLIVDLEETIEVEEEVIVTATRTGRLADDQATRVEVVVREEIEEKLLMTPGDIVMLLNETSGIRLQPTAPALGAASVRVQGMPGRFTSVLTDGLPINGTQVASLGLLQIPPMDLQQVEVIKGSASALYGPSALGGVINLVTRRPTPEHAGEAMVNVTSRSGADGLLWLSGPLRPAWGYTLLAGVHGQNASDVDGDRWADLPRYRRVIARPKLTFTSAGRGSLDLSGGVTLERRRGGGLDDPRAAQSVETTRSDAGLVWRRTAAGGVLVAKAAVSALDHTHDFGSGAYDDGHAFALAEASMSRGFGRHLMVVGSAVELQKYRNATASRFDYRWITPGAFVQDDIALSSVVSLSASARVDVHPEFGALWSPRASIRLQPGEWDVRVSAGRGAFAPTVFVEEVEEVGVLRIGSVSLDRAETAETWSMDVSRRWGVVEMSGTWFGSRIHDPVVVSEGAGPVALLAVGNRAKGPNASTRTWGAELFGRLRSGPWVATATHTWVNATQASDNGAVARDAVPLTPRRTFSLIAAWEKHGVARVGLEVYRTGAQRLEDNPFRTDSAPYTIIGLLAERRIGRLRVFVNLENLTDLRQSDYDPLLRPVPTPSGRLVVAAWAPLEGRTINGGVRFAF